MHLLLLVANNMSFSKKTFTCSICKRLFKTEKGVKMHMTKSCSIIRAGKKQDNIASHISRSNIRFTETSDSDGSVQQVHKKPKVSEIDETSSFMKPGQNSSDNFFISSITNEFVSNNNTDSNSKKSSAASSMESASNNRETNVLITQENTYQMNNIAEQASKSRHDLAERDLLKIVADLNCHNETYNRIMNWAKFWNSSKVFFNDPNYHFYKRSVVIDRLSKLYNMENMRPSQTQIQLDDKDGSTTIVNISTFNFQQQLLSLLRDKDLMDPTNLAIDYPLNSKPTFPRTEISEIKDSLWYENAYKYYEDTYGNDPSRLICGIILAIDKTHTDAKGKLCLESVNFSLSIFNTKTRRTNPRAWRSLGFVNDLSAKFGNSHIEVDNNPELNRCNTSKVSNIFIDFLQRANI